MTNLIEVALTSDANGALWSCCAWDPQAGTQLCTYKGNFFSLQKSTKIKRFRILLINRSDFFRWRFDNTPWLCIHQQ